MALLWGLLTWKLRNHPIFEFSDIADIYFHQRPAQADTHIVIVDIGYLNRAALATLLNKLGAHRPKVIGIDVLFLEPKPEDSLLFYALQKVPIVLVVGLDSLQAETFHHLTQSQSLFHRVTHQGYANLISEDAYAYRTVRYFRPTYDSLYAFALQIAALAYPQETQAFLKKSTTRERIQYYGNFEGFFFLSGEEILAHPLDLSWLEGKVLLLGFADIQRQSLEDIFFSPLNPTFIGKSFPDMYGIYIHANILSMIRRGEKFSYPLPLWELFWMVLILLFLEFLCQLLEKKTAFSTGVLYLIQVTLILGLVAMRWGLLHKNFDWPVGPLALSILLYVPMRSILLSVFGIVFAAFANKHTVI
ncbi:MAG: CHASE2 domain-containing protein [Bacteroidia bacterium]